MYRTYFLLALLGMLSGCSTTPTADKYAQALVEQDFELLNEYEIQGLRQQAILDINSSSSNIESTKYPLHAAISLGDSALVKFFIESGLDLNSYDNSGDTPLTLAVKKDKRDIVDQLLNSGVDINLATKGGLTPFMNLVSLEGVDHSYAARLITNKTNLDIVSDDKTLAQYVDAEAQGDTKKTLTGIIKARKISRVIAQNDLLLAIEHGSASGIERFVSQGFDLNFRFKGGSTPITQALLSEKYGLVREIIKHGADINYANSSGQTPLIYATYYNQKKLVELLIKKGADLDLQSNTGWTALHFTANSIENQSHDGSDIAKLLIKNGASLELKNNTGATPLFLAASNGRISVLNLFIKNGSNVNEIKDSNGRTPLIEAIDENHYEISKILLDAKADANKPEKNGWAPIHFTVNGRGQKHDGSQLIRLLVDHGADINQQKSDGSTALHLAVRNNRKKELAEFLKLNANMNISDNDGWTPLITAVSKNNSKMVTDLLKAGADINKASNKGWSPLHYTVNGKSQKHDGSDLIKILVSHGANINHQKDNGDTAVHLAVVNNRINELNVLMSLKADINIPDKDGWTPLISAVYFNDVKSIKSLLRSRAAVNKASNKGWSPIHYTVNSEESQKHEGTQLINLLASSQANINSRTDAGYTPLMLAAANGREKEAELLIKLGADLSAVNWKSSRRSALDYAVSNENYNVADLLRRNNAISGLEEARYPARPAPPSRPGYVRCNTRCNNADCYRTYSDGRKVRFRAKQKYNSLSGQYEWDSGSC